MANVETPRPEPASVPSDLAQRLAYLNLTEEDLELLRRLEPLLEKHAEGLVAAFYRQLLSFGPTRELLSDPEVKDRLLEKQRAYLLGLASTRFDAAFVEEQRRIGRTHQHIGLEPRWYLGAYALYFSLLAPVICSEHATQPEVGSASAVALQKRLLLDAQLAMEAYISSSEERLAYLTGELAEQGRALAREFEDQSATLRRTVEQARVAEELASIATLVTGLAHEIGTPMGVIQGHAKMLESAISDESAVWRLQTIQTQIARISRIIQMLLNMARPRRSRRQPVALEPLLDTTLSFVSEKLRSRGIELEKRFDADASVVGDGERLQQLFLNLFLNAADAMPEGGRLSVSLDADGDAVTVCVGDTGSGIPASDIDRIFDPFFTTKPAGEGNGLGLMVCKGIVGDHGGTLSVTSQVGEGCDFCIRLPLRPGEDLAAERAG